MTLRMVALFFALTLGLVAPAYAVDPCPDPGNTFLVDTPADAALVAGGYTNPACAVTITVDVTPTAKIWRLEAATLAVTGAKIINPAAFGEVRFVTSGDVNVTAGAVIKAREHVRVDCDGVLCNISVLNSVVLSSSSLDVYATPGVPGSGYATRGDLTFNATGDIVLSLSTIWAGAGVHALSTLGSITWYCPKGGSGVCTDPLTPPNVAAQLCPNGYPCTVVFPSAAAVRAVCYPDAPDTKCGGAATEVRMSSYGDLSIAGSSFVFLNHVTFESRNGAVLAGPKNGNVSEIDAVSSLALSARTVIDAHEAVWIIGGTLRLTTGAGCPPAATCINAQKADMSAATGMLFFTQANTGTIDLCGGSFTKGGPGLPRFNNSLGPVYPASVLEDAAECAPLLGAVID